MKLQGGGGLSGGRLQGVQYGDLHAKILQLQQQLAASEGGQEQQDAARLGELLSTLRSSGRMAGGPLSGQGQVLGGQLLGAQAERCLHSIVPAVLLCGGR